MKKNAMLAALGLLGTPLAAQAAPITVDFSVFSVVASFGDFYPANVTGSGHFTIDDSVIPAGGTGTVFDYESGLPTLDLPSPGSASRSTSRMQECGSWISSTAR